MRADMISGMPEPRAKSDGVKEDGRRPRTISRVLDNPAEIPNGCSMSTNTSVNILQYRDCQINAERRQDKMPLCRTSHPSGRSAIHSSRQPASTIISFHLSAL